MEPPRVVIVMGVAGSGKSSVGALLAAKNHGRFYDADDFHPAANIAKMAAGIPLDDADREPWLQRLRHEVVDATPAGQFAVLACSALKRIYREKLGVGSDHVVLVYLKGDVTTLLARLAGRSGHFMKAAMLESQLATLEAPGPDEGLTVDIDHPLDEIVSSIEAGLGLHFPA